jgi:hypothetical protein
MDLTNPTISKVKELIETLTKNKIKIAILQNL